MSLTSTHLQTVADRILTIFAGLDTSLKPYRTTAGAATWTPKALDRLPAVVIEIPRITRTALDQAEMQLGTNDWRIEYPVTFYFDLTNPARVQTQAVAFIEAAINAIDADPTLGDISGVIDAKLATADPVFIEDGPRAMVAYECEVHVLKLVAD